MKQNQKIVFCFLPHSYSYKKKLSWNKERWWQLPQSLCCVEGSGLPLLLPPRELFLSLYSFLISAGIHDVSFFLPPGLCLLPEAFLCAFSSLYYLSGSFSPHPMWGAMIATQMFQSLWNSSSLGKEALIHFTLLVSYLEKRKAQKREKQNPQSQEPSRTAVLLCQVLFWGFCVWSLLSHTEQS